MTSLDILEPSYCMDYSMQSSNDSKLPLPTQVISSPSCPPPLSYYENNPKAKDELIQKATARLRCRLLQEGISDVQSKVSHLRSQLDDLRIELSTTENVLSKFGEPDNRQLQALERRFNTHQQQLDHVLSTFMLLPMPTTPTTPPTPKVSLSAKAITASASFSSTLSRMSTIFSSSRQQKSTKKRTNSVEIPPVPELILNNYQYSDYSSTSSSSTSSSSEEDDHDMTTPSIQEAREKRIRRRQRVKQLRREYQKRLRLYDPTWNEDGDWQSAHSPTAPSIDNHTLPLEKESPSPSSPQKQQQEQQEPPHPAQQYQDISLSSTNKITTCPSPTTEKKRTTIKENSATAATPAKKKIMTTPTSTTPPNLAPAQCLCKRKSTNKPGPVRHHKAASTTSQTYHSKQPEWISLKKKKSPLNQIPPPVSHHLTAISITDNTQPPIQPNVSAWLLDQHQLHIQQQDNDDNHSNKIDNHYAENTNQNRSNDDQSTTGKEQNGQQQQQQALNLFDDVLHYLDTFSDFGSDTGLQQDISLLLSTFNKNEDNDDLQSINTESSCWSLHYPSSSGFYQQLQLYTILINHGMANFSQYFVECVSKGLSWCKFLSVLSLACLISLGRGPDHMLDDFNDLDLLYGQDELIVDSYYL